MCTVSFLSPEGKVQVEKGTTLLEAATAAGIITRNLCGGEGICGSCKMTVVSGRVSGGVSHKLNKDEILLGTVLSCLAVVEEAVSIRIPEKTLAKSEKGAGNSADRFRDLEQLGEESGFTLFPLVQKFRLQLEKPTLTNNLSDHQRLSDAIRKKTGLEYFSTGRDVLRRLPTVLRNNNFHVLVTVGVRGETAELLDINPPETADSNYFIIVDMGTTTIVAHLVDAAALKTLDARACFSSQGIYGREVTARMMTAEKGKRSELKQALLDDISRLTAELASANRISTEDISAIICAGNTPMTHFLLDLPVENIRRTPYVPVTVEPSCLFASEAGIRNIHPKGMLYPLPGISGWVGSDLTAGILATGMYKSEDLCLLVDIGTNGEVIVGNKEWLIACSASAGPALEGASVECGMRAENGAIEKVYANGDGYHFKTVGGAPAAGICGSGILDLISVLLETGVIDRSGKMTGAANLDDRISEKDGIRRFVLVPASEDGARKEVFISEADIENVITAKAAIFAAMKILLQRVDLSFDDVDHFYIAGGFGKHINTRSAVRLGLIPAIPEERIEFVGNTSVKGAKIASLYRDAFHILRDIERNTTYYDLMGADDYVEEFQKAMFLPHTDIELFQPHLKATGEK